MSSPVRSRAIVVLCRPEPTFEMRGQILAVRPNNEVLVNMTTSKASYPQ